jgi:alanyl-tRNA synthetase
MSRVERTIASLKDVERELARFKSADLLSNAESLMGEGVDVSGIRLWTFQAPNGVAGKELRELAQHAKSRAPADLAGVYVGAAVADGTTALVVACTPAAIAAGFRAGDVMTTVMERMGGRGGGKNDMAQGGGGDPTQIEAAFADVGVAIGRARG